MPLYCHKEGPVSDDPKHDFLVSLRQLLSVHLSEDDLRDLCFELDIPFDSLPGTGVRGIVRELILHCQRHGSIPELIAAQKKLRKDLRDDLDRLSQQLSSYSLLFPDDEAMYQYMAQRYGIGHGDLLAEVSLASDGSAQTRQRVRVESFSIVDHLDTFVRIPEADSSSQVVRQPQSPTIKSLTEGRRVIVTHQKAKERALSLVMAILPPLQEDEYCIYELVEQLPIGLYAVNDETLAKRNTPYDYWGWSINRPTRRLSLRVCFPTSINVTPYDYSAEVQYASAAPGLPSQHQQKEEQTRLRNKPVVTTEENQYVLTLDLDYPMIGLVYILKWKPLVAEILPSISVTAN